MYLEYVRFLMKSIFMFEYFCNDVDHVGLAKWLECPPLMR